MQGLGGAFGGLRAQDLSGNKPGAASIAPYVANFAQGSWSWTCPEDGSYLFVAWGAGGGNGYDGSNYTGGASGAYGEKTVKFSKGQVVTLAVAQITGSFGAGASTTITWPDSSTSVAGGAVDAGSGNQTGGVPINFDFGLNGSNNTSYNNAGNNGLGTGGGLAGGSNAGTCKGAGAPARLPFRGAYGAGYNASNYQLAPGPGAGSGYPNNGQGGPGFVIIQRVA